MPDWVAITLAVISVPLVAILGILAIAATGMWMWHKGRMARLEVEEKQRQAQIDRELLGLGSKDISANLEVILDRLNALEHRVEKTEAMLSIEAAKRVPPGRIPIAAADDEQDEEQTHRRTTLA